MTKSLSTYTQQTYKQKAEEYWSRKDADHAVWVCLFYWAGMPYPLIQDSHTDMYGKE